MSTARRVLRRPATTTDLLNLSPEIAAEVVDGELVEKRLPRSRTGGHN